MKVEIHGPLPIGSRLSLGPQDYVLSSFRPHERQDGTKTTLAVWQTTCPTCGKPFEAVSSVGGMMSSPVRRCQACRATSGGARVADRKAIAALYLPEVAA